MDELEIPEVGQICTVVFEARPKPPSVTVKPRKGMGGAHQSPVSMDAYNAIEGNRMGGRCLH